MHILLIEKYTFFFSLLQAAQAICQLSEVLGESLSSHHHVLLESLMQEIPGRLWEVGLFIDGK